MCALCAWADPCKPYLERWSMSILERHSCCSNQHASLAVRNVNSKSLLQVYTQSEKGSQVVNTAWAMLALLAADQHLVDEKPLHRAARCLLAAQLPSGDWPQQAISGVFNRNCMITYSNYRCTPSFIVTVVMELVCQPTTLSNVSIDAVWMSVRAIMCFAWCSSAVRTCL